MLCHARIYSSSSAHLVTADFLESPVNVEQRHVVSFAGTELFACGEHLLPPGGRVEQHCVHRQQRYDAQNLLSAGEVWRQQDGLQAGKKQGQGNVTPSSDSTECATQTCVCGVFCSCSFFTFAYLGSRGKLAIFFPRAVRKTCPSFFSKAPSSSRCSKAERTASGIKQHSEVTTPRLQGNIRCR